MERKGRPKGGKNIIRSAEEKMKFVSLIVDDHRSLSDVSRESGISTGLLHQWVKKFNEGGIKGLENSKRKGNVLAKYQRKHNLTREEVLEYEVLKLRIENMRLKKGYSNKEADQAKRK